MDDLRPNAEVHVEGGNGLADPHLRPAGQGTEGLDHVLVIRDEVPLVLPVLRLGIVRAQLDDHDVRVARLGVGVRGLDARRANPPGSGASPR